MVLRQPLASGSRALSTSARQARSLHTLDLAACGNARRPFFCVHPHRFLGPLGHRARCRHRATPHNCSGWRGALPHKREEAVSFGGLFLHTPTICRLLALARRAAAKSGVAGAVEKLGEPLRFRAAAVSSFLSRTQSTGGFTASDIYMRQSEPPCSQKSAVPRGIFGSLASSNGAQLMELAEVQAAS